MVRCIVQCTELRTEIIQSGFYNLKKKNGSGVYECQYF